MSSLCIMFVILNCRFHTGHFVFLLFCMLNWPSNDPYTLTASSYLFLRPFCVCSGIQMALRLSVSFYQLKRMSKSPRPFSSGSRLPPDPIDKYLMQCEIYRKHTARDPSSLFRVVSEQIFGCQNYHEFVREICVQYMTENKQYFKNVSG